MRAISTQTGSPARIQAAAGFSRAVRTTNAKNKERFIVRNRQAERSPIVLSKREVRERRGERHARHQADQRRLCLARLRDGRFAALAPAIVGGTACRNRRRCHGGEGKGAALGRDDGGGFPAAVFCAARRRYP